MIKNFVFYLPIKIVFGAGSFKKSGEEAEQLGKKALIVTGRKSTKKNGLLVGLQKQLADRDIEWVLYDKVLPNPTNTIIDEGALLARKEECDFVIGLGGGSSLDAAKAIAISAKSGLPIWRHIASWEDEYVQPEKGLPIMAIETLAGTGSESDNIAVVTNVDTKEKPGFQSPAMFPKVAIVDPEILLTVPGRITAVTGFDILCHVVEGYVTKISQPICEILNERAIQYVIKYLPEALEKEDELEARAYLALANVLAGISLTHGRATLLHAIEHPISGYFNVTHAEGLAVLFVKWMEFSYDGAPDKFKFIGECFGLDGKNNTKDNLINRANEFLKTIGLDLTLNDLGVKEEYFESIANDAMKYMAGGVRNNPVEATKDDIISILKGSM